MWRGGGVVGVGVVLIVLVGGMGNLTQFKPPQSLSSISKYPIKKNENKGALGVRDLRLQQ